MKKSTLSLLQYSAFTASFLSLNDTHSQAVYIDIDPDIILDSDGELGLVDMDNEGVIDFAFLNTSGTVSTSSSDITYVERLWAGPNFPQNGIAGYSSYHSGYGGFTIFFPYALNYGENVGPELPFHTWGFQRMAFRDYTHHFPSLGTGTWAGGYWYPEVLDHYLGVRFLDSAGCNHYGWIRCDVKDEGRTLVVKDCAYESKCDVSIPAGDVVGTTIEFGHDKGDIHTGINDDLFSGVSIYSFGDRVYINLNDINEKPEVHIYNIAGELVYSEILKDKYSVLELNQPAGAYFVQLVSSKGSHGVKVFIN